MNVVPFLSATISSALAIKPSTVYVLRVENERTDQAWHVRRCFTDFCELRDKLTIRIDQVQATGTSWQEQFPFLYKQFPKRHLFGSRSKRVIEQRTLALNQFLVQALACVQAVQQEQHVAIGFHLMSTLETFFDVAGYGVRNPRESGRDAFSMDGRPLLNSTSSCGQLGQATRHWDVVYHPQEMSSSTDEEGYDSASTADASLESVVELSTLRKVASCLSEREYRQLRMHYTASHSTLVHGFMETHRRDSHRVAGKRDARLEIAGLPSHTSLASEIEEKQERGVYEDKSMETPEAS